MRALLQRVVSGKVTVDGVVVAEIGRGLVVFIGVREGDTEEQALYLATKTASLRIFEDAQGINNLSIADVHGSALVVSQFTLYADANKGRRPSFSDAASPDLAAPLIDTFGQTLRDLNIPTQSGIFGARMQVDIHNDGPVTIWLEK
jgi:D-tyrosyl-tRNA(Tyr) deacylase